MLCILSTQIVLGRIRLTNVAFKFFQATSVPTFLSELLANTLDFRGYVMSPYKPTTFK
jgi:hypothetical protein